MDPHAAASLLDRLRKLPRRVERPRTFMEIGGYARSENVCSNLLAFFFDPGAPHGLGSLFLDALLDSSDSAVRETSFGGGVSVTREVVTEAGNRIDILIKADACAVLIENKLFAAVANPFGDYAGYMDRLKDETGAAYEDKVKILLTLYPSNEGREHRFVNLTYADFVGAVRASLGNRLSEAEPRYLPLALDFLNTLENFGKGTRMNQEYRELLAERRGDVEELLEGVNEVRVELREKVKALETSVNTDVDSKVTHIPWKPDLSLVHFLQTRVRMNERSFIGVQTGVSPGGWEVRIFSRGPGAPKGAELEDLLERLNIGFESDGQGILCRSFDYDQDTSAIAPVVREMAGKISREVGQPPHG